MRTRLLSIAASLGIISTVFADVEIRENGRLQTFVIACDELQCTPATARAHAYVIDNRSTAVRTLEYATELEAGSNNRFDLVLYRKGAPRTEVSRRVLSRKIRIGFEANAAPAAMVAAIAKEVGAGSFEIPAYAAGYGILTFDEPGASWSALDRVRNFGGVLQADPLLGKKQFKRFEPNDPLFGFNGSDYQWQLENTGQNGSTTGLDVNITSVWDTRMGQGVLIGIVDDGLDVTHPDLASNTNTAIDHDWNDGTPDDPTGDAEFDDHGTGCAGVAAARGDNGIGITGAAPRATLVGLRLIAGNPTDQDEAEAMNWKANAIQVKSNSWGPDDSGADLHVPGPLWSASVANSARTGRGGLGTIHVWAAGNGAEETDNSNYDGYANNIYTIAVGAIDDSGKRSSYSEPGANLVVSSLSDGGSQGITTTTFLNLGAYTNAFGGTSAACPLVAGIVALILEENPALGWRDVQEILMRSASKIDAGDADWIDNGAGFHFNHNYGAGMVDAQAAVDMAKTWQNLSPQKNLRSEQTSLSLPIPDNNPSGVTIMFELSAESNLRVEHVEVALDLAHGLRGDTEIFLTSPAGTVSQLSAVRDDNHANLNSDWAFMTVRNWGESSAGTWTLEVRDSRPETTGTLRAAEIVVYGTNLSPPPAPPVITSPTTDTGNIGDLYVYEIVATGSPTQFTAESRPAGLELLPDGTIYGEPEEVGVFTINLTATNTEGTATASLELTIGPLFPPQIFNSIAPAAIVGEPFLLAIDAPQADTITVNGFPEGLTFDAETATVRGVPQEVGRFRFSILATNAAGTNVLVGTLFIDPGSDITPSKALDAPSLAFETVGNAQWLGVTDVTHDGVDAMASGTVAAGGLSRLQTTVTGPAVLDFFWKVSSEAGFDGLAFFIDDRFEDFLSGEVDWERNVFGIPAGDHRISWAYEKDDIDEGAIGSDRGWLDEVTVRPIGEVIAAALDNDALPWSIAGSGVWLTQSEQTNDGTDALESPLIANNRSAVLRTRVIGPGTLTFAWSVDSELDKDFLSFLVDTESKAKISGTAAFATEVVAIPAGAHTLSWRYNKDETGDEGFDGGWIDQVVYTPMPSTYAAWAHAMFSPAQLADPAISDPDADPDHDCKPNVYEYMINTPPLMRDDVSVPGGSVLGDTYRFTFVSDPSKTDIETVAETSTDLQVWDAKATGVDSTDGTNENRSLEISVPDTDSVFTRLRIRFR
ncbi:MAG: subtilisin-like proprotein convertase family protein/subtilisin family serine protease [Verrucomicrobiales bacterium]|jgi:subtilisin-like proprotein convertase family protein/subtilisin family serine protease